MGKSYKIGKSVNGQIEHKWKNQSKYYLQAELEKQTNP